MKTNILTALVPFEDTVTNQRKRWTDYSKATKFSHNSGFAATNVVLQVVLFELLSQNITCEPRRMSYSRIVNHLSVIHQC